MRAPRVTPGTPGAHTLVVVPVVLAALATGAHALVVVPVLLLASALACENPLGDSRQTWCARPCGRARG